MLLKKLLIHSLLIALLLAQSTSVFAQTSVQNSVIRGMSGEQLPTLIVPQDSSAYLNPHKINRMQVNSVQWNSAGEPDEYKVYPDLSFDFIRKYHFIITPFVKDGIKKQELPDGYYYLRMILLKPKLKRQMETFSEITDQYITGLERVVRADGGIISTPVEFYFPSLAVTTFRNRLFIEIVSLKQDEIRTMNFKGSDVVNLKASKFVLDAQTKPVVLSMHFAPMQNADATRSVEKTLASDFTYDETLDTGAIMAEGVRKLNKRFNENQFLTPTKWAEKNNVAIIYDDNTFKKYASLKDRSAICHQMDSNINYKSLKFRRAGLLQRDRQELNNFCNNVSSALIFQKVQFIHPRSAMEVLHDGENERSAATTQLVVSLINGNNHSKSFDQFKTTSLSLSPLEWFMPKDFKIPGLSLNRNYMMNESMSLSTSRSGAMSQNALLEVRKMNLSIYASNTRSCYLVKLNQEHSAFKEFQRKYGVEHFEHSFGKNTSLGGHLVCQTERKASIIKEDYFHILPLLAGQGISDGLDPRNQLMNVTLRGFQDFNLFTYQIRESLTQKFRNKVLPSDVITNLVSAETVPGTHFSNYNLEGISPNLIERMFFEQKNINTDD